MTTNNPWQYEIAIERSSKGVIQDYPPIKLIYFSKNTKGVFGGTCMSNITIFLKPVYDAILVKKSFWELGLMKRKVG